MYLSQVDLNIIFCGKLLSHCIAYYVSKAFIWSTIVLDAKTIDAFVYFICICGPFFIAHHKIN